MRMLAVSRFGCAVLIAITTLFVTGIDGQQRIAAANKHDLSTYAPGYQGIVFTQIPAKSWTHATPNHDSDTASFVGARLIRLSKSGEVQVLTPDFESAADPAVSFDGQHVLFAAKRTAGDLWNIYEMNIDGSAVRQITRNLGNCRNPIYQSALFYLNDPRPSYQITFRSDDARERTTPDGSVSSQLYSIHFDGSGLRRLTYGPASSYDPFQMQDGRILFSYSQRDARGSSSAGGLDLFAIGLDGTDFAAFSGMQGRRFKRMGCTTPSRMVVFIESDKVEPDGSGTLATLRLQRNFHSYQSVTRREEGSFYSPSALPDGSILVSRRSPAGTDAYSIYRMDLQTRSRALVYSDPAFHSVQAIALVSRPEPDGHSSVVEDDKAWSKLYCLSAYQSDLKPGALSNEAAKRVRVVEAVLTATEGHEMHRRLLGEAALDEDGSFQLSIPPNTTVQVQLLNSDGMAVRSSAWFWTKNKENRGCIGCHEDGELTPENRFPLALGHSAAELTLPPERRRTVSFQKNVMPILVTKCSTSQCHGGRAQPEFSREIDTSDFMSAYRHLMADPEYVRPGQARTSRLVWAIFGRNTSRPWDSTAALQDVRPMPPAGSAPLTDQETRTIVEWIDLGAQLTPMPSHPVTRTANASGEPR